MDANARREATPKFYHPLVAWVLRRSAGAFGRLPRRLGLAIGDVLGELAYRFARPTRAVVYGNLRAAYGATLSPRAALGICRGCFASFGRSLAETLRLPTMAADEIRRIASCERLDRIESALARGRGVLILSAHMGAWEILAAWLGVTLGRPFHTIGRRLNVAAYNEVLVSTRRAAGVETVYQDESPRRALGVLRENRPLGILADQDIPRLDGVFVEFFSRPAHTPTAPVALARASGAPIVPVVITWCGTGHRVHVLDEVVLAHTGDRKADVVENTQRWSRAIEAVVRAYPEQWAWFHPRWRTRPPGE